jgi:trk system potassium uptake protein TrkA
MKIIVVGDGKVGYTLVRQLSSEGHDVTVIDSNPENLRRTEAFDVITVTGNGASFKVQQEAGVSGADLLIAVTSADEINIICCLLAKKLGAKNTIARVRNPEYSEQLAFLKDDLGLSMAINPEKTTAAEIFRNITFPSSNSVKDFARGLVELVECRIRPGSRLIGQKIFDIREKNRLDILVCILERAGKAVIPTSEDVFREDDKVYVTGAAQNVIAFLKLAGNTERKISSVMIIGGGRISYYLAERLMKSGLKVKIIENNTKRCAELTELLPGALIICGDGTDQELLQEEELSQSDAFIALTNIDEENLISSLFASKQGVSKVITKINRLEYTGVIEDFGIDCIISPKQLTAYQIAQYVRAMQNSMGSKVDALVKIAGEQVEVLEFTVAQNTRNQMKMIKDIRFKKNLVVAAIVHKGRVIVPGGTSVFQKGDTVLVMTMHRNFSDMNDIFE